MRKITLVYDNVKAETIAVSNKYTRDQAYDLAFQYADDNLPKVIKDYNPELVELYDHTEPRHHALFGDTL